MDTSDHRFPEDRASTSEAADETHVRDDSESASREPRAAANEEAISPSESISRDDRELENVMGSDQGTSVVPLVSLGEETRTSRSAAGAAPFPRGNLAKISFAAGLGCLMLIGLAVEFQTSRESKLLTAKIAQNETLASAVNSVRDRLDAIEATRGKEETADLRKVLSELKSGAAVTRDFGATVAQLSSRLDHVEKDQGARLDKLGERMDHDIATRLADIATRLDKIEKKSAAAALVASAVPAPPIPPKPSPSPAKSEPGISYETTGSIDKPRMRLHGYAIEDVHDGFAVVETRYGPQSVTAGDIIPGAGRVLRIERQGRDWLVVTSLGVISSDSGPY